MLMKKFERGLGSHPEARKVLGGPSGGSGWVGRATGIRSSHLEVWGGRESHPEVQKWWGGPLVDPGGVGRPPWRTGRGRKAHMKDREG